MYWHFLVEMDVGPIFLYQSCPLCPYESRKTNISQTNTFKIDISILQLLGLEHTLLSELTHISPCLIIGHNRKSFGFVTGYDLCSKIYDFFVLS